MIRRKHSNSFERVLLDEWSLPPLLTLQLGRFELFIRFAVHTDNRANRGVTRLCRKALGTQALAVLLPSSSRLPLTR